MMLLLAAVRCNYTTTDAEENDANIDFESIDFLTCEITTITCVPLSVSLVM